MAQKVKDVMTSPPISMNAIATIADAARTMRDLDIGDVLVLRDDEICGIVTDRDIVVRAIADQRDPMTTTIGEVCSDEMVTVSPRDQIARAIQMMREKAVRRLPVVEDGKPVGIVSLGDLVVEHDRESVLADISAAPPNT